MANKPYVVVEWNDTETDAKGWMCAYNFVGHYCGGGTRMHPTVTKEEVIRLATTMGYKYKACESLTTGGCKAGIAYDYKAPDAEDVLRRFLTATAPYIKAGVSIGGDLGVDYSVVLRILDDLGIGIPQTKAMKEDPDIHQGILNHDRAEKELTYDGFKMYDMITGYGVAAAADEAWKLKGGKEGASVVIQGFGCVGASCVNSLNKMGYKVVGIADVNGLVYCKDGLDIPKLVATRLPKGELNKEAFDKKGLIYGMGHAVYSLSDPRSKILSRFVKQLSEEKGKEEEYQLYATVERLAKQVIGEKRKIYKGVSANIDFYSGFIYSMLGLPHQLYTPLFAIARIVGWSAHRMEELMNGNRIIRPAYKAVAPHREYTPIDER